MHLTVEVSAMYTRSKCLTPLTSVDYLQFLSTEDRTKFRIHKMKFVLLQDQDDQSYMKSNIDLSKVKGYLHSMGNSVPENALELLNSVEQYQKVSTCSSLIYSLEIEYSILIICIMLERFIMELFGSCKGGTS